MPGEEPEVVEEGFETKVVQGGWGQESKSSKGSRHAKNTEVAEEDERLKMDADVPDAAASSEDEIPEIPEIGSGEPDTEDITMKVAEAPSVNVQVATMADLDRDLSSSLPFAQTEKGIDLKLLTNVLSPSSDLQEADEVWDFVPVFTAIKSDLENEREAKEAREESSGDTMALGL